MQKAKTNPTYDGDRIYDSKQKRDFTNEKTAEAERRQQAKSDNNDDDGGEQANKRCLQDETQPHGLSLDLEEFNSDDNQATLSTNSRRSQQLDVARQILDQLDEQINSLNELQLQQQNTRNSDRKQPISDGYSRAHGNNNNSIIAGTCFGTANNRSNYYYHSPLANLEQHGSLRARAIEARKLALDYYIETGIRHTGECACHFEHNQSDEHSRLHGRQIPSSSSSIESISCDSNNDENQSELNHVNDSHCDCERSRNNHRFAHSRSQSSPELSASVVEPSIESTTTTTSVGRTIGGDDNDGVEAEAAAGTEENIHYPIITGPYFGESSYSELFIENQSNDYELQKQPTRQHYHRISESTTLTAAATTATTTTTSPAELVRQGRLACGSSFIGGQTTTSVDAEKRSAANYSISSRGSHEKCNCSTSGCGGGGGDSSQASRELARIEREYSKRLTGFGGRSLQNSKQTTRQDSGPLLEAPFASGTEGSSSGNCGCKSLQLLLARNVSYEEEEEENNSGNRAPVQLAPAEICDSNAALVESSPASDSSCSLSRIVGEFKAADPLGTSGSSRNLNGRCNRILDNHHHQQQQHHRYPNESRLLAVDESNCEQQAAEASCFYPYPYASAECSLTDNSSSSLSLSWSQDFLQPYGGNNSASDDEEEEQAFVSSLLLGTARDIDFDEISINYLNSRRKDDQQNSLENDFQTTSKPESKDSSNSGGCRPRSRSYSNSRCCCCCCSYSHSHASGAKHSPPDKLSSRKQQRHFLDCISSHDSELLHYSACGTSPHEGEKLTSRASSSSSSSSSGSKLGKRRRYNSLTRNSISADELDSEQHSIIAASDDASGQQQSQRQRQRRWQQQSQLKQRRRQESAPSALADETVSSLPASFAAATSNLVVGGSKSSRSASPSCCSSERIRSDFNSGKDVRASSMRAVKDIAKMSVPSLSALQYLPSQIDQFSSGQKKMSETKNKKKKGSSSSGGGKEQRGSPANAIIRQTPSSGIGAANNMDHQRHSMKEQQQQQQLQSSAKINNLKIVTESSDDVKHDESCLLHRLCMCSCVARDHNQNQNSELDEDKLTRARAAAAVAAAGSNEPSEWQRQRENSSLPPASRTASFKVPKNKPKKKPNSSRSSSKSPDAEGAESETLAAGDRSDSATRRPAAAANEQQPQISDEKQSPRFLNLLRPSSALAKRSREPSVARKPLKGHTGDNFIRCLSLGSEGNLQSRASSSAQDDDDDDDDESSEMTVESGTNSNLLTTNRSSSSCSLGSSSLRRPMSQPEQQQQQRVDSRAAGSHNDVLGGGCDLDLAATTTTGEDAPERSKSACSSRQQDKLAAKGGFKRFLAPKRRLFASTSATSSSSKSVGLEALIQGEIESRQQTETVEGKQTTKSFLSRSLTRLSQRATRFTASSSAAASPSKKTSQQQQQLEAANSNDRLSCDSVRSNCVSPTISITSSESVQASLASYSSTPTAAAAAAAARGHNKCDHNKRHVSAAPEIVLNKVEYARDISDSQSSQSSYTMARIKGASSTRYYQSGAELDRASANRGHYGSGSTEAGLGAGLDAASGGGGGGGERACSLPPSPRRYRRLNQQSGGPSPRLRRSPVSFRSPAALSTKIEDGLKVCSTEHFEKHIGNVKGNQEDAQKELFRAWINHFAPNLIRADLVDELKDGVKLIGLLAALTRDKQLRSSYEKLINDKQFYVNRLVTSPASRLKHLANVGLAVDYLRKRRSMKLVNLNPMDIVSGKPNVILGLCWSIILNFQLEQNFTQQYLSQSDELREFNNSSEISSNDVSYCTSRLSNSSTNEDSSTRQRTGKQAKSVSLSSSSISSNKKSASSLIEEYGTNDLVAAKRRLLERVNRQFDLKLTNLTSNLLDGDVLLAIIRRLVPNIKDIDSAVEVSGKSWNKMSNEEKLDCCFDIAETHLGIPRLIRGSELGRQQPPLPDTSTKSSLIYLSMLLNSGESPSRESQAAAAAAAVAPSSSPALTDGPEIEQSESAKIEHYLADIDVEDKFEIGNLDSTLKKIRNLQEMISIEKPSSSDGIQVQPQTEEIDENLVARCRKLKEQADQIEALIAWINQADSLLDGTQKSAADLSNSIEAYRNFFSPANIPKVETSLCPTLERQYRTCLGLAKQRVLSMEQTLKNWISYEEARKKLRDWLVTSETKLSQALNPAAPDESDQRSPLAQHTSRLNDLIDYFELETVGESNYHDSARMTTIEQMPISLLNMEHDSVSISGSMISIGSNSSRMSTLQSSKKASYNKLFDDFEFKCRLLATTLDPEQRESLLLGVKELSCRLRYITEQKVPQVVTELRMSINRCEMSIQELDESDTSAAELDEERRIAQAVSYSSDYEVRSVTDAECEATQSDSAIISDSELSHTRSPAPVFDSTSSSRAANVIISNRAERLEAGKATVSKRNIPTVKRNASDSTIDEEEAEEERVSSVVQPAIAVRKDKSNKSHHVAAPATTHKKSSKSRKSRKRAQAKTSTNSRSSNQKDDHKDVETSAARRLWDKIVRTFRTNLPLNIVLLVCLAGLFAVPMINKDACCELAQKHISTSDEFHKPV